MIAVGLSARSRIRTPWAWVVTACAISSSRNSIPVAEVRARLGQAGIARRPPGMRPLLWPSASALADRKASASSSAMVA